MTNGSGQDIMIITNYTAVPGREEYNDYGDSLVPLPRLVLRYKRFYLPLVQMSI